MSNLPTSAPRCDVAIVGGGCAGTLVASQLLRRASGPLRIVLFERSSSVGRGVAYGTDLNEHQLNVCAARMSALPDEPEHFLNWARYSQSLASSCVVHPAPKIYGSCARNTVWIIWRLIGADQPRPHDDGLGNRLFPSSAIRPQSSPASLKLK